MAAAILALRWGIFTLADATIAPVHVDFRLLIARDLGGRLYGFGLGVMRAGRARSACPLHAPISFVRNDVLTFCHCVVISFPKIALPGPLTSVSHGSPRSSLLGHSLPFGLVECAALARLLIHRRHRRDRVNFPDRLAPILRVVWRGVDGLQNVAAIKQQPAPEFDPVPDEGGL